MAKVTKHYCDGCGCELTVDSRSYPVEGLIETQLGELPPFLHAGFILTLHATYVLANGTIRNTQVDCFNVLLCAPCSIRHDIVVSNQCMPHQYDRSRLIIVSDTNLKKTLAREEGYGS